MLLTCERGVLNLDGQYDQLDVKTAAAYTKSCYDLCYEFVKVLRKYNPDPDYGYYNYQAPAIVDWQNFYFGGNYNRLQSIKRKYDPLGLFSKPYTVQ
jgi:hypothetical protein